MENVKLSNRHYFCAILKIVFYRDWLQVKPKNLQLLFCPLDTANACMFFNVFQCVLQCVLQSQMKYSEGLKNLNDLRGPKDPKGV
jgi:hypothetical protein